MGAKQSTQAADWPVLSAVSRRFHLDDPTTRIWQSGRWVVTCTCGDADDEHEVRHGSYAECLVDGCDCIHFEHGEDDDDA